MDLENAVCVADMILESTQYTLSFVYYCNFEHGAPGSLLSKYATMCLSHASYRPYLSFNLAHAHEGPNAGHAGSSVTSTRFL